MNNLLTVPFDPVSLITQSKKGIQKSELLALQNEIHLTNEELAHALQISTRALLGYDYAEQLKVRIAERALALAQLYARGFEVMGKERFLRWMSKEHVALGQMKAKELLDTHFGIQLLLDELGRIEHGVLA
ncbi:antitoxin Xre/MbcA/ParS toxin-binding domain-containing protein [Catalinimonas sp. 4WD22]|uniref:antitoxin Xre/MbcA/ParS toxin-binding domain-containing protein n=1 Tax=Catalinimonas locisalis TaxID=3133978 RepID=UPI0031014EC5